MLAPYTYLRENRMSLGAFSGMALNPSAAGLAGPIAGVLAGVRALSGAISKRSDAIEQARCLPSDILEPLIGLGVFRLLVPRALGGLEAHPSETVEILEALAEADASVAWCVMIAAQTGLVSAYLPKPHAETVFGDPHAVVGGVFAPTGTATLEGETLRINGRWRWGSGSGHSTWVGLGCQVIGPDGPRLLPNGQPDPVMVMLPAGELELQDTWHTAGLKGTGSGDIVVRDACVPISRSFSLVTDRPVHTGIVYGFPAFGLLAIGIAAVACGNARAALAEFAALAAAKKSPGARRSTSERSVVQAGFAEAHARLAAARALLMAEIGRSAGDVLSRGSVELATRAGLRLAATHLTRTAAEVIRVVHDMAGGSAVFLDNSLQRRLRDAQTMTAHVMIAPATYELTGRVLLGLSIDDGML